MALTNRPLRLSPPALFAVLAVVGVVLALTAAPTTATPAASGYRDFNFGPAPGTATRNKPEAKLWWNGGVWWACLYRPAAAEYRIHRLDPVTEEWVDTGTAIDNRAAAYADVLWTGEKLYVTSGGDSLSGLLYRFSFDALTGTYSRDAGFPVTVRSGGAETLSLARDTTGRLWITYEKNGTIWIACSNGSDTTWLKPFALPVQGNPVYSDDISAVLAFGPGKIGLMWSNQLDRRFYFAIHDDSAAPSAWRTPETPLPLGGMDPSLPWADDHINLTTDATGTVYAAVKTSLSDVSPRDPEAPLVMVLARDPLGNWKAVPLGRNRDSHTQPGVLIDQDNGVLYAYATAPRIGGSIYYKAAPLRNLAFPLGLGTPLIRSTLDPVVNSATSAHQLLSRETGLVVLASDDSTDTYLHAHLRDLAPVRQTATYPPTADAYVDATFPSTNYGKATTLQVDASPVKECYLRFDPATVSGTVLSAKLRLYVKNASDRGGTILALSDLGWSETGVTYATRPALDGVALATLGPVTVGQWIEIDVTARIVGSSPVAFGIRSSSKDGADYAARENTTYAPQLVVEYAP